MPQTVAVDFDGTVHPYTAGWQGDTPVDEPPCPGAQEFLDWCGMDQGWKIVIFSARARSQEGKAGIDAWCRKHGLLVDEITHIKPYAFAYVDDRGVTYSGDWEQVKKECSALASGHKNKKAPDEELLLKLGAATEPFLNQGLTRSVLIDLNHAIAKALIS
jgi:hypothetical protein